MFRGSDALGPLTPGEVDCCECGKSFALNAAMLSRVRELEARGLAGNIDGFVCLECSGPSGPPAKPRPLNPLGPFDRGFSDA